MPFNYNQNNLSYMPIAQGTLESASKSPFEIAGKAMSGLEDALDNRLFNRDIQGVNSLEALNSMRVPQTKEAMAQFAQKQGVFDALNKQSQFDKTFGLSLGTLGETTRHNMATEGKGFKSLGYGTGVNQATGEPYIYSRDDGSVVKGNFNIGNGTNIKNIVLKEVKSIDENGLEVTNYVPMNKLTGKSVSGSEVKGEKRATVAQKDKDFIDNFGALSSDFTKMADILDFQKNPDNKSLFGIADNAWDATVGALFQTKDNQSRANILAMNSGMMQKVIKQFGSNPSDIDMKALENQIPQPSDSPESAKDKFKRFQELYLEGQQRQLERLKKTNPEAVSNIKDATTEAPVVGMKDGGYVFLGGDPSDSKNWRAE